jgi:hypothetical protein
MGHESKERKMSGSRSPHPAWPSAASGARGPSCQPVRLPRRSPHGWAWIGTRIIRTRDDLYVNGRSGEQEACSNADGQENEEIRRTTPDLLISCESDPGALEGNRSGVCRRELRKAVRDTRGNSPQAWRCRSGTTSSRSSMRTRTRVAVCESRHQTRKPGAHCTNSCAIRFGNTRPAIR